MISTCVLRKEAERMEDSLVDSERLVSLSMLKIEEQAFGGQEKDDEEKQDKEAEEVGEAEDDNEKEELSNGGGLIAHEASALVDSIPGLSPRETEEEHKREDGALADGGLTDQLPVSKQDEPSLAAEEVSLLISIIED